MRFDRLEARVVRTVRSRTSVVRPGDLVLLERPLRPEDPATARLVMCPRCAGLLVLTAAHAVPGPDHAPTVLGTVQCPPCGAHWTVEGGRIAPLPGGPARDPVWRRPDGASPISRLAGCGP